jgi:hypothetical protein
MRILSVLLVSLVVAGCSTTVTTRQALDPATSATLKFDEIEVASTISSVTPTVQRNLKQAVSDRLAKSPQGTTPAKLRLSVTEFRIVEELDRALWGAFGGSNKMTVSVVLLDAKDQQIAAFEVARSANPGGYGAFYDQTEATIAAVADGVAEALMSQKVK